MIDHIYGRMRDRSRNGPYDTEVLGLEISVLPNVYSPIFFTDSAWFSKTLSEIVGPSRLLEIGTGTGLISLFCASKGAEVTATDINPKAVENSRLNANRNDISLDVRQGNVFSCIDQSEKFDFIFWAHPFNYSATPSSDPYVITGFDYLYESLEKYISQAPYFLSDRGRLLLGSGDSADLERIYDIAERSGYGTSVIREERMPIDDQKSSYITYMVLEFFLRK